MYQSLIHVKHRDLPLSQGIPRLRQLYQATKPLFEDGNGRGRGEISADVLDRLEGLVKVLSVQVCCRVDRLGVLLREFCDKVLEVQVGG